MESGLASPDDVPEVVESNFRYKGPNPQSKETGIVSLADIVESATRSMGKISCEEMQKRVDELLKQRVVDGHLDDCGLTFGDLKKIRNSFIKTLKSIHHNRIAYPSHNPEAKIEKPVLPVVTAMKEEEKRRKGRGRQSCSGNHGTARCRPAGKARRGGAEGRDGYGENETAS